MVNYRLGSVRRILILSFLLYFSIDAVSKTLYDTSNTNILDFFQESGVKYVISCNHSFGDTLRIAEDCELSFKGGSLSGVIVMQNTKLSGAVNLKGSTLLGSVKNKVFDASWLCYMDGVTDDAANINNMIDVCGKVFFPKGSYRLISSYSPMGAVDEKYHSAIQAHIGIYKSKVQLIGEEGAELITDRPLGTICVFSRPNQIENSIKNIKIEELTFTVCNDGKKFHEFMHVIKIIGVNGLTIKNCQFNDFWGDAICLSHYGDTPSTGERTRNQNVRIINNHIEGGPHFNNRNGISIINGSHVLIQNNVIKNTSRKDMPGGIDIEPNNSAYTIDDIRILNNVLGNIRGGSGAIGVCVFDGGPAYNIRIERNKISRSQKGIQLYIMTENTTGNITIKNNTVAIDTYPYNFVGGGKSKNWVITGNSFDRPVKQSIPGDISVDNLTVRNNKKKQKLSGS